jgi:RecA/RadA recombinase
MPKKLKRRSAITKLSSKIEKSRPVRKKIVEFISTGCTMFNLALSGWVNGGFARGRVLNIVGDGSTGKTLVALEFIKSCLDSLKNVNSKIFKKVKKIRVLYYNAEAVMDFDLEYMYGLDFVKAIEFIPVETVEEWAGKMRKEINKNKAGEALIIVLDSLDVLESKGEQKRIQKALKNECEMEGSYGMEKVNFINAFFKSELNNIIKGKDVTLVVISQTRKKIGVTFGDTQYRTGGSALDFLTHQVPWLAVEKKLTKEVYGERKTYGVRIKVNVKRSKVWKPYRLASFIILFDYGFDDIGSNIDYYYGLKEHKATKKLKWGEKEFTRDQLIKYIEDNDLEERLKSKVQSKWDKAEAKVSADHRKRRF